MPKLDILGRPSWGFSLPVGRLPPTRFRPLNHAWGGQEKPLRRQTISYGVVLKNPFITSTELKKMYPELLRNVATCTIRERLQRHLHLPSQHAAVKPLATAGMKCRRLQFARRYEDWTPEKWMQTCFSDELTFKTVHVKHCRWSPNSIRYHPIYSAKVVKHPPSVMVWGTELGTYFFS